MSRRRALLALATALLAACATPQPIEGDRLVAELGAALRRAPVVLLGEVHDNVAQHRARAAALHQLFASGARPALAFEQFDREQQADLDRARSAPLPTGADRVAYLIEQAGARGAGGRPGWNWDLYRPYLELALEYDLPIVAANLSRPEAMRVAREGYGAVFDAATIAALGLDRLPEPFLHAHEQAVDAGHCYRMPGPMLPTLARAQIARDATLATAIRPYLARGVVLLTGNGHARRDIGVPFFLPKQAQVLSIGLLESDTSARGLAARFDVAFYTQGQTRPDPCAQLPQRS